jgi:hypothetical protein
MMRTRYIDGCAVFILATLFACRDGTPANRSRTEFSPPTDSAFAQVQHRGHAAMGVDQYTSTHRFEPLPDGGRITLMRDGVDPAGVAQIRAHMTQIAASFGRGDFSVPGFVHDRAVPGTDVMKARRSRIHYTTDTVPNCGSLRLSSTDSVAIAAIHQFLAFQRSDHRVSHAGASD